MDRLVRSNIISVSENEGIIVNLTIPTMPESINILSGTICNKCTGRFVSKVIVTLYKLNDRIYFDTISNRYGEYLFFNIPKGKYIITFYINGFILCSDYLIIGNNMINWYKAFIYL